jgi:Tol biopolymer transport system component
MLYFFSDRGGNRDLWRVGIDEASGKERGVPEAVTTGVTHVMAGCISADGKRLVIQTASESDELLRNGFDPASARPVGSPERFYRTSKHMSQMQVSKDDQWITARMGGMHEDLIVMRTDGTKLLRLMDDAFRDRGPVWIRGDEWICFYSNRGGEYQLWLIRADGTDARPLTHTNTAVNLPIISPDGTQLACFSSAIGPAKVREGMAIVPVQDSWFAASAPAPITDLKVVAEGLTPLAWSPDGRSILAYEVDAKGTTIVVYTLATNQTVRLPDSETYIDHGLTWMPDSRHLLSWHGPKNAAMLIDAQTGAAQEIPGMIGPAGYALSSNARLLFIDHTLESGDIWMLTLR